ncbi:hypothetical protein [Aquabacterium sp. NJ1]|uniref:hypothetical protein n=1 Tax=Aquabacterium sp. NJ1 TaxID=1538295 RepID=UPI001378BAE9|nr:hypothetical protein [Aquabacterium sp. NJ1]
MAEVLIERVPQGKMQDWLLFDKPFAFAGHKAARLVFVTNGRVFQPIFFARPFLKIA